LHKETTVPTAPRRLCYAVLVPGIGDKLESYVLVQQTCDILSLLCIKCLTTTTLQYLYINRRQQEQQCYLLQLYSTCTSVEGNKSSSVIYYNFTVRVHQ